MSELRTRVAKLQADAAACAHIGELATDSEKRELFVRLARHLTGAAQEMECASSGRAADSKG